MKMNTLWKKYLALLAAFSFFAAFNLTPPITGAEKKASDEGSPEEVQSESAASTSEEEAAGQEATSEKRKKILEEATAAIRETENAISALDDEKPEEALEALERATGKLEILLAREPELALAPAGVSSVTHDIVADLETIEMMREEVGDAVKEGRIQDARRLIDHLASETVVRVTNIPLGTYPDAIKLAVSLIDEGKHDEAVVALQTALNTLVISEVLIPLPVVSAEASLLAAETLAEKKDRTDEENTELVELLESARTELEFAQALGYGSHRDFENLFDEIETIEKKTEDGKSGFGFFDKIRGFLDDTTTSSQPEPEVGNSDDEGAPADGEVKT